MYSVFQDVTSQECYVVSQKSVEYTDYLTMVENNRMTKIYDGTKRQCEEHADELLEAA
jgi:hypothetical protein